GQARRFGRALGAIGHRRRDVSPPAERAQVATARQGVGRANSGILTSFPTRLEWPDAMPLDEMPALFRFGRPRMDHPTNPSISTAGSLTDWTKPTRLQRAIRPGSSDPAPC